MICEIMGDYADHESQTEDQMEHDMETRRIWRFFGFSRRRASGFIVWEYRGIAVVFWTYTWHVLGKFHRSHSLNSWHRP